MSNEVMMETENCSTEKNETIGRAITTTVVGGGMACCAGIVITEVIDAVLPAPAKAISKVVRLVGTEAITMIVYDKCVDFAEGAYDAVAEVVVRTKTLSEERREERKAKKAEKKAKKKENKKTDEKPE